MVLWVIASTSDGTSIPELPSNAIISGALGLECILGFGGLPDGAEKVDIDGVSKLRFPPLFQSSPLTLLDVDVSELLDFSTRHLNREALGELVQDRLKQRHLVLSCTSLPSFVGTAGKDPNKQIRASHGNTPDWYAVFKCVAPDCKTKLLVGGFFSNPPSPEKGQQRSGPSGLQPEVLVWGHPTKFEQKRKGRKKDGGFLSNHVLHCVCEHRLDESGKTVEAHGRLKGKKREKAREEVTGRRMHTQLLADMSPGKAALGNFTEIPRNCSIVNQLHFERGRLEKPWGNDVGAGLKLVKNEHLEEELSSIPSHEDSSKRILGVIRTYREEPLFVVLMTELMLGMYWGLAGNGFGCDYTGGIMKKVVQTLPNGQQALKQVLLFVIVAVNPYTGKLQLLFLIERYDLILYFGVS